MYCYYIRTHRHELHHLVWLQLTHKDQSMPEYTSSRTTSLCLATAYTQKSVREDISPWIKSLGLAAACTQKSVCEDISPWITSLRLAAAYTQRSIHARVPFPINYITMSGRSLLTKINTSVRFPLSYIISSGRSLHTKISPWVHFPLNYITSSGRSLHTKINPCLSTFPHQLHHYAWLKLTHRVYIPPRITSLCLAAAYTQKSILAWVYFPVSCITMSSHRHVTTAERKPSTLHHHMPCFTSDSPCPVERKKRSRNKGAKWHQKNVTQT